MVPCLLSCLVLQRVTTFMGSEEQPLTFDSTYEKIKASGDPTYDFLQDREQLGLVFAEISAKGLIPPSYQMAVLNLAMMWYFLSSFVTTSFALLYYRKFRET